MSLTSPKLLAQAETRVSNKKGTHKNLHCVTFLLRIIAKLF